MSPARLAPICVLALCGCSPDSFVSDAGPSDAGDAASPDVADADAGCDAGMMSCGGACVETTSNIKHCGACDNVCAVDDGGAPVCMHGACVYPMGDTACLAVDNGRVFWTNGRGAPVCSG